MKEQNEDNFKYISSRKIKIKILQNYNFNLWQTKANIFKQRSTAKENA